MQEILNENQFNSNYENYYSMKNLTTQFNHDENSNILLSLEESIP